MTNSYDISRLSVKALAVIEKETDRSPDGQTDRQTDRQTQKTKCRTLDLKLRARFDWPMEMSKESKFHENRPRKRLTLFVKKSHKSPPFSNEREIKSLRYRSFWFWISYVYSKFQYYRLRCVTVIVRKNEKETKCKTKCSSKIIYVINGLCGWGKKAKIAHLFSKFIYIYVVVIKC